MEDSRLGQLEQQISSFMTMIEGFIKKTKEHMEMMETTFSQRRGFNVQKNEVVV